MAGPTTKSRQFQTRASDFFDDRLPSLCPPDTSDLQEDLNVIRTLLRLITGEESWCNAPSATLRRLFSRVVVERQHSSLVYLGGEVWQTPEKFVPESLSVFVNGMLLQASGLNGYDIVSENRIRFKTIWMSPVLFTLRYVIKE